MGDYFRILRMPLWMGRGFDAKPGLLRDTILSRSVMMDDPSVIDKSAIVDIPGSGAGSEGYTIIGVVDDVRSREGEGTGRRPHIYVRYDLDPVLRMTVLARMTDAGQLENGRLALQQVLTAFDAQLPSPRVDDMEAVVSATMSQPRFGTAMIALLALGAVYSSFSRSAG